MEVLLSVSSRGARGGYNAGTHGEINVPTAHEGSLRHVGCLGKLNFNRECIIDDFFNVEGFNF